MGTAGLGDPDDFVEEAPLHAATATAPALSQGKPENVAVTLAARTLLEESRAFRAWLAGVYNNPR